MQKADNLGQWFLKVVKRQSRTEFSVHGRQAGQQQGRVIKPVPVKHPVVTDKSPPWKATRGQEKPLGGKGWRGWGSQHVLLRPARVVCLRGSKVVGTEKNLEKVITLQHDRPPPQNNHSTYANEETTVNKTPLGLRMLSDAERSIVTKNTASSEKGFCT